MSKSDKTVDEFVQNFQSACEILSRASENEFKQIIDSGCVGDFLNSIFNIERHSDNVFEYLLKNKDRAEIIARIWYLTIKYPYKLRKENPEDKLVYVSPYFAQWFDDGIMLTIGNAPFRGPIALYKDGKITYAVTAREISDGEKIGPKDLKFITPEEQKNHCNKSKKMVIDLLRQLLKN